MLLQNRVSMIFKLTMQQKFQGHKNNEEMRIIFLYSQENVSTDTYKIKLTQILNLL